MLYYNLFYKIVINDYTKRKEGQINAPNTKMRFGVSSPSTVSQPTSQQTEVLKHMLLHVMQLLKM